MKILHNKIGVQFDETHKKTYDLGGVELQRATSWVAKDDDGSNGGTTQVTNVNHLETNPQIANVVFENPDYPQYKIGDKLFLHYLAYEWSDAPMEIDGLTFDLIDVNNILFTIVGEELKMPSKCYLGQSVIDLAPKTASGIFLTSVEDTKNPLKVKITHSPNELHAVTDRCLDVAKIGDTVTTVDSHNYEIEYGNDKYIFLKESEIVAIGTEELNTLEDRLIVKINKPKSHTDSGIFILESARTLPNTGIVQKVGKGRYIEARDFYIPMTCQIDDLVLYVKGSGTPVDIDGEDCLIIKESDILSVLVDS